MDDNKDIRDLLELTLETMGHQTAFAQDGQEAIDLYRKEMTCNSPFDVVIMDLTISGGMGGKEAIKKLIDIHPEVNAVVFSGYSNDPVVANYKDYGFKGTISKPFRIDQLSQVLQELNYREI
jgi:CheY-like chemotaxis protein